MLWQSARKLAGRRDLVIKLLAATGGLVLVGGIAVSIYANPIAQVGAGYKAKILCSEVFVAGRNAEKVAAAEFNNIDPMIDRIGVKIDLTKKSVTASIYGLGRSRAVYRDGYGCTLVKKNGPAPLPAIDPVADQQWPEAPPASDTAIARIDYAKMNYVLDEAIANGQENLNVLAGPAHRGFVVAVDGKIVAERYADGFTKDTPFLSWSMAKSVTATLVGAAALHGYLDVSDRAPAPEWEGDPKRAAITWDNLLRMQSGLAFEEVYEDPSSDVSRMLFTAGDTGAAAAIKPLIHAPGEYWSYSSGTTNLVSRTLRQILHARGVDYHAFARDALFGPIGAASAVMEPDASGAYVGSSFVYATARDWAKLGQLYLQDGVWKGERLLPEGWTDYVRSPAPESDGQYGAHFWLNRPGADRARWIEGLPDDVYVMAGHEGQYVFIIPDKNAVIVRTRQTRGSPAMDVVGPVVADLYRAIGKPPADG